MSTPLRHVLGASRLTPVLLPRTLLWSSPAGLRGQASWGSRRPVHLSITHQDLRTLFLTWAVWLTGVSQAAHKQPAACYTYKYGPAQKSKKYLTHELFFSYHVTWLCRSQVWTLNFVDDNVWLREAKMSIPCWSRLLVSRVTCGIYIWIIPEEN